MGDVRADIESPPSSGGELGAWAKRCGVEDLLDSKIRELAPFLEPYYGRYVLASLPRGATLRQVVVQGRTRSARVPASLLRPLIPAAASFLQFHARQRYEKTEREHLWQRPLPTPELRRVAELLRKRHDDLLRDESAAQPALYRASRLWVDPDLLLAGERFEGHEWGAVEIIDCSFSLEVTKAERFWVCDCQSFMDQGVCPHLRVAIGRFLDLLHDESSALREALAGPLAVSPGLRLVRQIERVLPGSTGAEMRRSERLVWRLGREQPSGQLRVGPYLQRIDPRGRWTRGRKTSLRDLPLDHPAISPEDRLPLELIHLEAGSWTHPPDPFSLVERLIGHPLVFDWEDPSCHVQVRMAPLRFALARDAASELRLGIEIGGRLPAPRELSLSAGSGVLLVHDSGIWTVVKIPRELRAVVLAVARANATPIAPEDTAPALDILAAMASRAEVGLDPELGGEAQQLGTRPAVRVAPIGEGLDLRVVVPPPDSAGDDLEPGAGPSELFRAHEGTIRRYRRDLEEERQSAESVGQALEDAGAHRIDSRGDRRWHFEALTPEIALEALLALHHLGDVVELTWPEGIAPWRVTRFGPAALRVEVASRGSLFEIGGGVTVDGTSVSLASLLAAIRRGQRFVRLGPGRFARIEAELRERCASLERISSPDGRGGLTAGGLAASRLEAVLGDAVEVVGDESYHSLRERIFAAERIEPRVPSTLRAKLRPYQKDGFQWLARLAEWPAGAILADDMGLGKTLQALAVLLRRAKEGPALVIAPTSVCAEWRDQAARFAPGLEVVLYRGAERERALSSLGPRSLLIASYGIVQRDVSTLAAIRFATLVLDEAQAIKNARTGRARAVRELDAAWKLALTGTPLENHLGELWAIFRTLEPGLLGSWEHFRGRWAQPIEKSGDRRALDDLAAAIRPFLLRRTKTQVAPELPPRTEVVRHVVLSRGERALYEAARAEILERLATGGDGEDRRFAVLAAITRLRQLACNPRLVDPGSSVGSAKLETARELVEQLVDEGQRALVFSQFTRHLALLREVLDERGIAYLYLDGSTPAERRDQLVARWREEAAPLFLVSLKAGGTGLNLIGADFVLHLDPWWNPAVEDQATDRTHRIGQSRPVTVVRLVAEGTIEEAVVALHERKRELARGLLEGAEVAATLGTDELLDLVRGGGAGATSEADTDADEDHDEQAEPGPDPATPGLLSAPDEEVDSEAVRAAGSVPARPPAATSRESDPTHPLPLDEQSAELATLLDREVEQGLITPPSVATYLRVVRRIVGFATEEIDRGAATRTLLAWCDEYLLRAQRGELAVPKSDPLFARAIRSRLEELSG